MEDCSNRTPQWNLLTKRSRKISTKSTRSIKATDGIVIETTSMTDTTDIVIEMMTEEIMTTADATSMIETVIDMTKMIVIAGEVMIRDRHEDSNDDHRSRERR
eukprot:TRINITY_DN7775_c0_g2_i4.p2 TRINITY_DN7775_c0_g2~~TRINITY_DN7775_c0_g2_i4.p2  ORF type:complete len:103 (+),score=3.53 TRINITY_DN7775_c0_g2_i4:689-997(+)